MTSQENRKKNDYVYSLQKIWFRTVKLESSSYGLQKKKKKTFENHICNMPLNLVKTHSALRKIASLKNI